MTVAKKSNRNRAPVTPSQPTAARKRATRTPAKAADIVVPHATKPKLVRDSFTIPKSEYAVLEGLKVRAANLTRPAKKSELLRAGIAALFAMDDKAFLSALIGVPSLKTGRPKGSGAKPA